MNNCLNDEVKRLAQEIDRLSIDDKVQLIQAVLKSSGLQVVMNGENFIHADVVLQIQNGTAEQLTTIIKAVANRVDKE